MPLQTPILTSEQKLRQARRLCMEEMHWTAARFMGEIKAECTEHVVIPGRILWSPAKQKVVNTHEGKLPKDDCYGVSCAVCGEDLGWYCPVNPKGYCEYGEGDHCNDDCIHCHQPDERK